MFTSLIHREIAPVAWSKIPWHEPEFSRRMLAEHLNQSHDAASRRQSIIDAQVQWIHRKVLRERPARILDLACGPGFYTSRLTRLGHTCTGLDISPAAIAYAREQYIKGRYELVDLRTADYGDGYDLACLIYGEFNAFSPAEAEIIVAKAHAALKPGGQLLLEIHSYAAVERMGNEPATWFAAERGLFADEPYLCLTESRFVLDHAVTEYTIVAAGSGALTHYTSMHQAYTDDEYRRLLGAFKRVLAYPSLTGSTQPADLFVLVAEKAAAGSTGSEWPG